MPWNLEHKEKSKERILEAAAHLFITQGFDAISIDDVMQEAGMTRGAFYAHFSSKAELYNEAILIGAQLAKNNVHRGSTKFEDIAQRYLNLGSEPQNKDDYCPLAFLITDIGHHDEDVQATYARTLSGYQSLLREFELSEAQAVQISVLLIGGLALSRAVNDDAMKKALLKNSFDAVMAIYNQINS